MSENSEKMKDLGRELLEQGIKSSEPVKKSFSLKESKEGRKKNTNQNENQ